MKKILAIGIALLMVSFLPMSMADEEISGTFTPTGGTLSISVNNTTPAFGSINLGASSQVSDINVTNDGTVNASITCTAQKGPNDWELVAGTASPTGTNQFCINMKVEAGGFVDIQSQQTLSADLPPTPYTANSTYYALKVFVGEYTNQGTPSEQTVYANLTVTAVS